VVLVEDKAAREFVRALLDRIAPDLSRLYQIIDVGDNSKVVAALTHFPSAANWLSMVGLLDGDQRNTKIGPTQWRYEFLPGDAGPERLLRLAANAERLSDLLGIRGADEIGLVLADLEGRDDHDWLEQLPRLLGVAYEAVVGALMWCWLDTDGAGESAEQVATFIRASAG
jgi:hypothetical protein